MSAYAIVDGIFIGYRLNDIGLAAINLAWPITAFLQSIGFAFGISSGIYITRLIGKGDLDKASKLKRSIVIYLLSMAIFFGGLFYIFKRPILELFQASGKTLEAADEYITIILYGSIFQMMGCAMIPLMKNYGHVKIAMASSLVATFVNFTLDYLMIFKFNYGLKGAAVASVIAQVVSFFVCFIPYIKDSKGIIFDKESIKELFIGSLAPFILSYSYSVIIILTNALCEKYGGDACVAAYTVLSYLLYVVNAASQGTGDAIQPLFSYHSELKEYKTNYKNLRKCIIISMSFTVFALIIFYIFRRQIGILYGLSDDAKKLYMVGLIYYSIGFIFISVSKVICSYLYSVNKKILANILVISEPLVFTPLGFLIFILIFNINGIWIGFTFTQVSLSILAIIFYFVSRRDDHERIFDSRQTEGAN